MLDFVPLVCLVVNVKAIEDLDAIGDPRLVNMTLKLLRDRIITTDEVALLFTVKEEEWFIKFPDPHLHF